MNIDHSDVSRHAKSEQLFYTHMQLSSNEALEQSVKLHNKSVHTWNE
jgi:hypothetical protein